MVDFDEFLSNWCLELPKPLVVFIDEVDTLIGDSLLSVLRKVRSGYGKLPAAFPLAMCLISLRDIRDYRIFSFEKAALDLVYDNSLGQRWLVNALGRELCFASMR